ncbi:uncharacterized protein LOC143489217 isoform X2 [Brachyhypopomus gauderio]|uniref:uncharacterized protein LOC143489217 isoform X2 n=1 Tax=Brachyhypopomus gauderio TaxID=698409 RepID=UPI0040432F11
MRRFFRAHRDEDFSQIQYLTAKCSRLALENALQRECVVSRERVRTLQGELESRSLQLCQKEHACQDLRLKHDQLLDTVTHQRGLVQFLQQQMVSVAEESSREGALLTLQLEQVRSDLKQLHTSEAQLQGLVEELHQETHHTQTELREEAQLNTKHTEDLEEQLAGKSRELEELQKTHAALQEEMSEQNSAHQRTVAELQQENTGSLDKLRQMAEQFEWLCEQQRHWMCCVKRFKDCLSDEKEALLLQVNRLQVELAGLRKSSSCEVKGDSTSQHCESWEMDAMVDLQVEADRWRLRYEELFSIHTSHLGQSSEDADIKPP